MASALAAAHEVGVVHRDFKPGNVVLVGSPGQWRAVVTDFGLALRSVTCDETASLSSGHGLIGTLIYMAPEQLEGQQASSASDIYSLGLVIFEMVTGVRPFQGDTPMSTAAKRLAEAPPSPRKFESSLSFVFESVILRCLARDPAKRFANAQDVAKALRDDVSSIARHAIIDDQHVVLGDFRRRLFARDRAVEFALRRVVLEQVGQVVRRHEIVDRDDIDRRAE